MDAGWHNRHVPGLDVVRNGRVLLDPDLDPSTEDGPRRHRKPLDALGIERLPLTIDTKPPAAVADLDLGPGGAWKNAVVVTFQNVSSVRQSPALTDLVRIAIWDSPGYFKK